MSAAHGVYSLTAPTHLAPLRAPNRTAAPLRESHSENRANAASGIASIAIRARSNSVPARSMSSCTMR